MAQVRKGQTGRWFFTAAVFVVFTAIIATVLGANDLRNLNLILARFGYPPVSLQPFLTYVLSNGGEGQTPPVRIVKGVRLPSPTIRVPTYGRADLRAPPASFVRAIRKDPRTLCETLRTSGFTDIVWSASAVGGQGSECSSFRPVGTGTGTGETSSVFISLKGDKEDRVSSFRVKLNIESEADRRSVIQTGSEAVAIFLNLVQWQDDGEIVRKIEALEEFERDDFGSHILFKREFGDLPRYNFLARQSRRRVASLSDIYFEPSAWLPINDAGLAVWMPKSGLRPLALPGPRPPSAAR